MQEHQNELSNQHYPNGAESSGWRVSDENNYQSAMGYIDELFTRRSRLLVIRVDFYVHASDPGHSDPEIMKGYLNKFLNNARCNSLFNNQIGYIWGFEYGQTRGYHFHMLFFFDGARSQQDITRSRNRRLLVQECSARGRALSVLQSEQRKVAGAWVSTRDRDDQPA
jgi:hypothetical protein